MCKIFNTVHHDEIEEKFPGGFSTKFETNIKRVIQANYSLSKSRVILEGLQKIYKIG